MHPPAPRAGHAMAVRQTVFIGIGSNLGDSLELCRRACQLLNGEPELWITARSPFYRTAPYGHTDQPEFLNAVIQARTRLSPRSLLEHLLNIEQRLGRKRREKWGPRTIDLDLLFYGGERIQEEGLEVPHPDLANRAFVLAPLCDLAPNWIHPLTGQTVRELLEALAPLPPMEKLDLKLWRSRF